MRHQLLSHLFRERKIESAGDVDCRQFLVFAPIVPLEFRTLDFQVSIFGVCLRMNRYILPGCPLLSKIADICLTREMLEEADPQLL
jgi:hypothetical protein